MPHKTEKEIRTTVLTPGETNRRNRYSEQD